MSEKTNRTFWWWLTAVMTPIGIVGGPIALADLTSGLIEWKGAFAYAVNWWDLTVSEPFSTIFQYATDRLNLPRLPSYATDYLAVGILTTFCHVRASKLVKGRIISNPKMLVVFRAIVIISFMVIAWPYYVFISRWSIFRWLGWNIQNRSAKGLGQYLLYAAPIIFYLMMLLINILYT